MTTKKLEPSEWAAYFDAMAKRVPSLRVAVSILGDRIGAQHEAEGALLIGISYDGNDDVLTIDTANASHRVESPSEIYVREQAGLVSAIEAVSPDGTKEIIELQRLPALPAS